MSQPQKCTFLKREPKSLTSLHLMTFFNDFIFHHFTLKIKIGLVTTGIVENVKDKYQKLMKHV